MRLKYRRQLLRLLTAMGQKSLQSDCHSQQQNVILRENYKLLISLSFDLFSCFNMTVVYPSVEDMLLEREDS
jgi:hypothetical protein